MATASLFNGVIFHSDMATFKLTIPPLSVGRLRYMKNYAGEQPFDDAEERRAGAPVAAEANATAVTE